MRNIAKDWPFTITALLVLITAIHAAVAHFVSWPWLLPHFLTPAEPGALATIYLGMGAVAAISAGFAGVIIVFGLTPTSDLFRRFRQRSGERMVSNWLSVIGSAFCAAAFSLLAAFLDTIGYRFWGGFAFELGSLLLLHSAVRSLWVLRILLDLVRAEDIAAEQRAATARLGRLGGSTP